MKYIKTSENTNLEEHLFHSIDADRLYKVKELIEEKGVDKNCRNTVGYTPLLYSVSKHKKDIVKYLIEINSDLNTVEFYRKETALMIAARDSLYYFDLMCDLIEAGADWNIKNKFDKDFLELIIFDKIRQNTINKYPEKYKEYLIKKEVEKYNL